MRRATDSAEDGTEGEDEEAGWETYEEAPALPTIDRLPEVVDYSTRGPRDWVVSGPLGDAQGPGRKFNTEMEAYRWATEKYGRVRVSRISAGEWRWAVLVKGTT